MKRLYNKKIIFISYIVIFSIIIGILCSKSLSNALENQDKKSDTSTNYSKIERDTSISVNSEGILQISRTKKDEISMGQDNTWTLFLYITGSNLESQYQYASLDIEEIVSSNFNEENIKNLNIIIQTGGSKNWKDNHISGDKLQRYKVDGHNKLTLLEELENTSMGDDSTLYDFLNWGVKNYPSKHMGVIFWNHGSGVSKGLCNDENFENDSLSVHELEYSFAKVSKNMTSKFEVIGFDTCLSGSLEYANLLAPYSKYMIASADIEPGEGWHYTPAINYLLENPNSSGLDFGKIICDTYADSIDKMSENMLRKIDYTQCVYDLSKVDNACIETNYLTKYLYDRLLKREAEYWTFSSMRSSRLRYNLDNTDIGSILHYLDGFDYYDYDTTYFRKSLNELITYSRISDRYKRCGALGISLYLPSSLINLQQLNNYRNVCFSPYWLKLLEWVNIRAQAKTMEHFQYYHWESSPYFFESTFDFMNYDSAKTSGYDANSTTFNLLIKNKGYKESTFPRKWYCNILNAKKGIDNSLILTEDDLLQIKNKTNEKYKYINYIETNVCLKKGTTYICLGQKNRLPFQNPYRTQDNSELPIVNFACLNFDNNIITDNTWFMLPDGQLLTTYVCEQTANSTIYSFPVVIDDVESSIRIEEYTLTDGSKKHNLLGIWDSSNQSDSNFTRGYLPLNDGCSITPIYDVYDANNNSFDTIYGEEFIFSNTYSILTTSLPKNYDYYYTLTYLDDTYSILTP